MRIQDVPNKKADMLKLYFQKNLDGGYFFNVFRVSNDAFLNLVLLYRDSPEIFTVENIGESHAIYILNCFVATIENLNTRHHLWEIVESETSK